VSRPVTINRPWRSPRAPRSVRVMAERVVVDHKIAQQRPVADAMVDIVQGQVRGSGVAPAEATMRRHPHRPRTVLVNTGRFLRGIRARLKNNVWVTEPPPGRIGSDLGADGLRNVRAAIARVIDGSAIARDKRFRDAQIRAWRSGVKVERMRG